MSTGMYAPRCWLFFEDLFVIFRDALYKRGSGGREQARGLAMRRCGKSTLASNSFSQETEKARRRAHPEKLPLPSSYVQARTAFSLACGRRLAPRVTAAAPARAGQFLHLCLEFELS